MAEDKADIVLFKITVADVEERIGGETSHYAEWSEYLKEVLQWERAIDAGIPVVR
jgi:hypothetical protein